ncbi:MFS transporter [Glutamicibacter halophytocola]|uniref:MFS transporter n=1 Tax=Glutamicibacter halophytocola TaxID=1933880 RepID=UPI00321A6206
MLGTGLRARTLRIWLVTLLSMLTMFGVSTWPPQIMRNAGYGMGSSVSFLLAYSLGAMLGTVIASLVGQRIGVKPLVVFGFSTAAAALLLMTSNPGTALMMLLVALTGFGGMGTQNQINDYIAQFYPGGIRATGLGWALAVGRLGAIAGPTYGAMIIATGTGVPGAAIAFAIPAVFGAALMLTLPRVAPGAPATPNPPYPAGAIGDGCRARSDDRKTMNNTQQAPTSAHAPVAICGGGPSGLFLALDLAQRGIPSVLVEPRTVIDRPRPRAKTTNARTMTHLRRLGLADAPRQAAAPPTSYSQDVIFCSTLSGYEITRFHEAFQLSLGPYRWQPECGQQIPQPVVEEVLRAQAASNPLITCWYGYKAISVAELDEPTGYGFGPHRVSCEDAHGNLRTVRADFVVGADGASSVVRKSLGIRLEGGSAALSNVSAVFTSAQLGQKASLDPAVQYWALSEGVCGMIGRMDLDNTWWAIIQGVAADDPDFDAAAAIRTMAGKDIDLEILATDPWTARMLLASSYGRPGIYLVGDAAHLNPPWGGHGFNTCIGDASNLAWKLAAVVQGWAGPGLLASYEAERRQIAQRTISEAAENGKALAYDFASPAA